MKAFYRSKLITFLLLREGRILLVYEGPRTASDVSEAVLSADFHNSNNSIFFLSNSTLNSEFEDFAFFYRSSKVGFGFLEGTFSLIYTNCKHNATRVDNPGISILQWARGCRVMPRPQIRMRSNEDSGLVFRSYNLTAITDDRMGNLGRSGGPEISMFHLREPSFVCCDDHNRRSVVLLGIPGLGCGQSGASLRFSVANHRELFTA
jgi:hypothetical protein